MAKDRRSRDQKRRDKKVQKARNVPPPKKSLAYFGDKYKTEKLIMVLFKTEVGIYETFVMTDRKLLDQTVADALEKLIKRMRVSGIPTLETTAEVEHQAGQEDDLVMSNICRNWAFYFEENPQLPNEKLIGVLRTILGSLEKVRSPGPLSQSYLHHISGFLTKKLGVSVKKVTAELEPIPEPPDDELLELGHRWADQQDPESRAEFHELAGELLRKRQAKRVLDACHILVGEIPDAHPDIISELTDWIQKARTSLVASMG